ncbi:MAG TPA: hypothetical protein VF789_13695 [Thermoanaerobaculia bacterium]
MKVLDDLDATAKSSVSSGMTRRAAALIEEITQHVRQGLEARLSTYSDQGRPLEKIGSPQELARRMLEVVPVPSRWDDLLGPFYSTRQISAFLGGVSRQAIADRRERRTLLGLKTSDGVVVFPTFQFNDRNEVLAGLSEVLQCFRGSDVDDWTLAGWLVSPLTALEGQSVIQCLRSGKDPQPLLVLARDAARRFAQ